MHLSIGNLAEATLELEPLPEVSQALLQDMLKDVSIPQETLIEWIKIDPLLSLWLLYLANSRSFGAPGQVLTLEKALQVLEPETIRDILLSRVSLISLSPGPSMVALNDHHLFWKHSLACARFSEALARATKFPEPSVAYLAGLLHDMAKITLYRRYSSQYRAVFEIMESDHVHLFEAEAHVFDSNHSAIGGKILTHWNVPKLLRQSIASHHYPASFLSGDKAENVLAQLIKAADTLAYRVRQGDGGNATRVLAEEPSEDLEALLAKMTPEAIKTVSDALEVTYRQIGLGQFNSFEYLKLIAQANHRLGHRSIELRTSLRQISLLHRLHQTFTVSGTLEELLAGIARELLDVLNTLAVAFLIEPRHGEYQIYIASGHALPDAALYSVRQQVSQQYSAQARAAIDPLRVPVRSLSGERVKPDEDREEPVRVASSALFDLPGHNKPLGALGIFSDQRQVFLPEEHERFRVVAQQIAMAIDRLYLNLETQRLSMTDGLTGLYNYRQFQVFLEREVQSSQRYRHPVSLILVDLDHFKRVNDKYGHLVGDQVLQEVAELLRELSRETDIVARYGGEEFVILLPKTSLEGAHDYAERIRAAVEKRDFAMDAGQQMKLTISLGVGCFPAEGVEDGKALIEVSDMALYEAKNAGRNRVVVAPNPPELE